MKQFTLREFINNPDKAMKSAPFQLVKYGKPFATVLPDGVATDVATHSPIIEKSGNVSQDVSQHTRVGEIVEKATAVYVGHCEAPYCKHTGTVYDGLYKEWFNGELKTKPIKLCKAHLQKYADMTE